MKFIIIGLGNFGSSLSLKLTEMGHEVIGADVNLNKVEALKDRLTFCINLDATDENAIDHLPLKESDVVVVAIGENEGDSILATAIIKQKFSKRIISRAVTKVQSTVMRAMGIDEIIFPEEDAADRLAMRLNIEGIMGHLKIYGDYNIVEAMVPDWLDGKTLHEAELMKNYNILVLTSFKNVENTSVLWMRHHPERDVGIARSDTVLNSGDVMVVYGHLKDIRKMLEKE
ncbi:MAG: TrkA family potassium uptake protein [Cyclobacteriaceae bacterium]